MALDDLERFIELHNTRHRSPNALSRAIGRGRGYLSDSFNGKGAPANGALPPADVIAALARELEGVTEYDVLLEYARAAGLDLPRDRTPDASVVDALIRRQSPADQARFRRLIETVIEDFIDGRA